MAKLYVVATPIGNLEDISLRALRILKEADLILCEDTRTTKRLLGHYKILKPTASYHAHSQLTKVHYILSQLSQGRNLALVSEAGAPGISDPGSKLIAQVLENFKEAVEIISVPGPSALISALSVSGLPADKFLFLGFPPSKKKRKKFFQEAINSKYTVVFYESPHRILKTLGELNVVLNASKESRRKQLVLCRELTKKFETIYRGGIEEIISQLEKDKIRGEFVVIVGKKYAEKILPNHPNFLR